MDGGKVGIFFHLDSFFSSLPQVTLQVFDWPFMEDQSRVVLSI